MWGDLCACWLAFVDALVDDAAQIRWDVRLRSLTPITDADFCSALLARGAVCPSLLFSRDERVFIFLSSVQDSRCDLHAFLEEK